MSKNVGLCLYVCKKIIFGWLLIFFIKIFLFQVFLALSCLISLSMGDSQVGFSGPRQRGSVGFGAQGPIGGFGGQGPIGGLGNDQDAFDGQFEQGLRGQSFRPEFGPGPINSFGAGPSFGRSPLGFGGSAIPFGGAQGPIGSGALGQPIGAVGQAPFGRFPGQLGGSPGAFGPGSLGNGLEGGFGGPAGSFGGPSGAFGGPSGSFGGPSGAFGGPSGAFGGIAGAFGGPSGAFGSNSLGLGRGNFGGAARQFGPGSFNGLQGQGAFGPGSLQGSGFGNAPGSFGNVQGSFGGPGAGIGALGSGSDFGGGLVFGGAPGAYQFGYGVEGNEYNGGATFSLNQNSDGYQTSGHYDITLPGGNYQSVTYSG